MPEKLRAAIILREIEELTYEEIAEVLNSSIGTVKSRISRARNAAGNTHEKYLKESFFDGTKTA